MIHAVGTNFSLKFFENRWFLQKNQSKNHQGKTGVKDMKKASDYFERSINANNERACCELGILLIEGIDLEKNVKRGVSLLERSSKRSYIKATRYLCNYYEEIGDFDSCAKFIFETNIRKGNIYEKLVEVPPTFFFQSSLSFFLFLFYLFLLLFQKDFNE